jgi:hypothetical protein
MFDYNDLSREFVKILEKRNKIKENYKILQTKLSNMKSKYVSLISNNNKKIFINCLDSFFFQYKILSLELDHYDKLIKAVFNRMYGDYYKLFTSIVEYCAKNMFEIDGLANMEKIQSFKDVGINIEYKTEDLSNLHANILSIIKQLLIQYDKQDANIKSHDKISDIGFSITSFLDTLGYENRLLYEQIKLYNGYLLFHHHSQNCYLDKTLGNMESFGSVINKEILVNHKNIIKQNDYIGSPLDNPINKQNVVTENVVTENVVTENVDVGQIGDKDDNDKDDNDKDDNDKDDNDKDDSDKDDSDKDDSDKDDNDDN